MLLLYQLFVFPAFQTECINLHLSEKFLFLCGEKYFEIKQSVKSKNVATISDIHKPIPSHSHAIKPFTIRYMYISQIYGYIYRYLCECIYFIIQTLSLIKNVIVHICDNYFVLRISIEKRFLSIFFHRYTYIPYIPYIHTFI